MISGLTDTKRERERERARRESRESELERERESTRGIGPPCKLWSPCKLRPPCAVCHASFVHHLASAVQTVSTVPLLFLPRSLSFPLTNHGQIFNCMSLIYNPPPTPIVAVASRSNHRSHCLKPQTRYHFSRSCHHRYPSLSLKPSLSTSLTTGVLSEEGGQFFLFWFFCLFVFIYWDFLE